MQLVELWTKSGEAAWLDVRKQDVGTRHAVVPDPTDDERGPVDGKDLLLVVTCDQRFLFKEADHT